MAAPPREQQRILDRALRALERTVDGWRILRASFVVLDDGRVAIESADLTPMPGVVAPDSATYRRDALAELAAHLSALRRHTGPASWVTGQLTLVRTPDDTVRATVALTPAA